MGRLTYIEALEAYQKYLGRFLSPQELAEKERDSHFAFWLTSADRPWNQNSTQHNQKEPNQ